MARQPTGNPVGKPPKPINWEQFEQLCGLQCTQSEMASMFKMDPRTLSNRVEEHYGEDYVTIYKRYSECGKCSLRRNQFVLTKRSAAMGIWLGKQWIDQKENMEIGVTPETVNQFKDIMNQLCLMQAVKQKEEITDKSVSPDVFHAQFME